MPQYKCVPAPKNLVIDKNGSMESAVRDYADLINREAVDGWIFHSQEEILVSQNPGCLMVLLGQKAEQIHYNMLIFVKQ